jgi:hypothetical protein
MVEKEEHAVKTEQLDTMVVELEGAIEPDALVDILADGTVVIRDDE